ncbi:nitroreductase [Chloroflexota bacterium]
MNLVEAICTRKSIRGYKPDPVPKEVLREILEIASRSPSPLNTQPWDITVITGQVLDNIKRGNIQMLNSGAARNPEVDLRPYEGKYRQRQVDVAIELFRLMGIAREDKEKRREWRQKGCLFYNAPAAIILSVDKSLDGLPFMLLSIGAIMQTICLVALDYGLATCIEGQSLWFPEIVRKFAGISESKRMIISITIGYPDWDFPANALETKREPTESFVSWFGWS